MMRPITTAVAAACLLLLTACNGSNLFTEPGESGGGGARGAIVGSIIAGGIGLGDVQVILVGRDSVRTDGEGEYRFRDLPAGVYTLGIRVPFGYELAPGDSATFTRTVTAGGEARADWTLLATDPIAARVAAP